MWPPHLRARCSRAFSEEVDTGSWQKMRPNQNAGALIRFHRIEKLTLAFVILTSTFQTATAHQIGLAEQVLQPVSGALGLLPLLTAALLLRRQTDPSLTRPAALALAVGLAIGLCLRTWLTGTPLQPAVPLSIAAAFGLAAAAGLAVPSLAALIICALLGLSLGANLHSETNELIDLAQSLAGAWVGTLAALQIAVTLPQAGSRQWQAIGERIIASWSLAIATIMLAMTARSMM